MGETIFLVVLGIAVVASIGTAIFLIITNPSLTRNWSPDQAVMPSIHFLDGDKVRINNVRDIHYRSTRDYDLEFYDRTINLDDVDSAWLAISPFAPFWCSSCLCLFWL